MFSHLDDRALQREADACRNRRDAFSFGSPHADEHVQRLARIMREQERRRDARRLARELEEGAVLTPADRDEFGHGLGELDAGEDS